MTVKNKIPREVRVLLIRSDRDKEVAAVHRRGHAPLMLTFDGCEGVVERIFQARSSKGTVRSRAMYKRVSYAGTKELRASSQS